MNRERIGKKGHKAPKFRDFDDDSIRWEEKREIKKLRKKKRDRKSNFKTEY